MAKGRKPDKKAQSNIEPVNVVAAAIDPGTGNALEIPELVQLSPAALECWHIITDGQTRFSSFEVPLLEQYCIAYAAASQAAASMINFEGGMDIVGYFGGNSKKKNPAFAVWLGAVKEMRQLSGVLALDTLTAERLNLTRAQTASIAVDLPARIREQVRNALDEG